MKPALGPSLPWAPMSTPRWLLVLLPVLLLAGCGGSDDGGGGKSDAQPAATAEAFPSAKGKTMRQLRGSAPEGPIVSPAVSSVEQGENRFAFALFDVSRKPVRDAQVAVYTAARNGKGLRGPYPARQESLDVKPQFRSQTTAADTQAAKTVYVAQIPFESDGPHLMTAMARVNGKLVTGSLLEVDVGAAKGKGPPEIGDPAVDVHTPTLADVGGDAAKIDTRIPPAEELLKTDLAAVLGKQPVVLAFATPALCVSRTCGPTVDIVEQVRAKYGDKAAFIHMEVYNDNKRENGFRPQLGKWRLPTEPWVFVIGKDGKIADRFEGVVSAAELDRAVAKATGG